MRQHRLFLLILIAVALLTLFRIGQPPSFYGDEGFYVGAARDILTQGIDPNAFSHPPLGKYIVTLSITIIGDNPLGWRAGAFVFSLLGLIAVYLINKNFMRNNTYAVITVLLVGLNPFWFIHARVGMLEIFSLAFLLWSFWGLIQSRESFLKISVAGILFGLSLACKWTALLALPIILLYLLRYQGHWIWELNWLSGAKSFLTQSPKRRTCLILILKPASFIIAALLVYSLTYLPIILRTPSLNIIQMQLNILKTGTLAVNEISLWSSTPIQWLFGYKPIWYFYKTAPMFKGIFLFIHPLISLTPLILIIFYKRYQKKLSCPEHTLLFLLTLSLFVGWLIIGREKYLYYLTDFMPFYIISLMAVMQNVQAPFLKRCALGIYILVFVISFPILTALPLPQKVVNYLPLTNSAQTFYGANQ